MFGQSLQSIMKAREQHAAAYKRHLAKLRNRPRNVKSAPLLLRKVINIRSVEEVQNRMADLMASNLDHLKSIHLRPSMVDDFLTKDHSKYLPNTTRKSNLLTHEIQEQNKRMGSRLRSTTSVINTRLSPKLCPPNRSRLNVHPYKVPPKTLDQYRAVISPVDLEMVERLLRPCVFFELRPLGQIKVQLFTEACPEMVLQFVRVCTHQQHSAFKIDHIFPELFVNATIQMDEDLFKEEDSEYDTDVVDFSKAGVLSFDKRDLSERSKGNRMHFSITLKPLPVLNGDHIPFGVVTKGQKLLGGIGEFGTKKGKIKKQLVVAECGMAS